MKHTHNKLNGDPKGRVAGDNDRVLSRRKVPEIQHFRLALESLSIVIEKARFEILEAIHGTAGTIKHIEELLDVIARFIKEQQRAKRQ